jgi:hypothetical protein
MNIKSQLAGTWVGLVFLIVFGLSLYPFAGFLPPSSPTLTQEQVAALFRENPNGIRFGMMLMMFAGCLMCVFVGVVSVQLKRIEKVNAMWTYTQLVAGACGALVIIIAGIAMTAAAFRPERPPEITYMMFDFAWLMIVMPAAPAGVQTFAIGFAILSDKNAPLIFPRWLGYFSCWVALLYFPGALVGFFKTGPFAWNGLLAFWLAGGAFGLWYIVMFFMLRKAIRQQASTS